MRKIDVAITGFGTVGKQVGALLLARAARYRARFGAEVCVTGVCGSSAGLCDDAGLDAQKLGAREGFVAGLSGPRFIERVRANVLFEASPTDLVTGGAGMGYMKTAMARGMHVIAISKGALALDHAGLRAEAARRGVALKLSGATSSALPTVDLLQYNLAGCEILSLEAILTGTTNLILAEMMDKGVAFDEALREAQRLGIAESNPALDVDGWDTACKLVILANEALDAGLDVHRLPREGIGHVGAAEVAAWRAEGVVPKLVGCIERAGGKTQAGVRLRLYPTTHPFSRVDGRTKAIRVVTDLMGEVTVTSRAGGPMATAAAAVKDFEHVLASTA